MLKKPFVITLVWLSGSPVISVKKIIPDGPVAGETQEAVDGGWQGMRQGVSQKADAKCVMLRLIPFIIKSP
jgi:hypothetical protein